MKCLVTALKSIAECFENYRGFTVVLLQHPYLVTKYNTIDWVRILHPEMLLISYYCSSRSVTSDLAIIATGVHLRFQ